MCKGAIFSKFFNFSGLKTAYQQQSKSSAYQKAHLTNSASQRTFFTSHSISNFYDRQQIVKIKI